jgi:hypothetical protein
MHRADPEASTRVICTSMYQLTYVLNSRPAASMTVIQFLASQPTFPHINPPTLAPDQRLPISTALQTSVHVRITAVPDPLTPKRQGQNPPAASDSGELTAASLIPVEQPTPDTVNRKARDDGSCCLQKAFFEWTARLTISRIYLTKRFESLAESKFKSSSEGQSYRAL